MKLRTITSEKELEQVTLQVKELKEENKKLREQVKRIKQVKRNIGTTSITGKDLREISTQTSNNKSVETATVKKNKKRKIEEKQRTISKIKKNSQLKINSSEGKMKGKRFKRKLSYPLDSRQKEMEDVEISSIVGTNSSRKKDKTGKKKEREDSLTRRKRPSTTEINNRRRENRNARDLDKNTAERKKE